MRSPAHGHGPPTREWRDQHDPQELAELIKPTQLDVEPGNDPTRKATVVAEPLERGFGLTLGNALRRVLLSSLQGAAITSVQIDNVLHEFSSVAGVREDVTDIVLNLKGVALRMEVEGPEAPVDLRPRVPGVSRLATSPTPPVSRS